MIDPLALLLGSLLCLYAGYAGLLLLGLLALARGWIEADNAEEEAAFERFVRDCRTLFGHPDLPSFNLLLLVLLVFCGLSGLFFCSLLVVCALGVHAGARYLLGED